MMGPPVDLMPEEEDVFFSSEIVNEPVPVHFKSAKIRDYDGKTDPEEHLSQFENVVMLH